MSAFYFLKTEKTSKIPDYIQVRDENFVLISYFTVKNIEKGLTKLNYNFPLNLISDLETLPEGKLHKVLTD